ncbi:MAG: hypothetical protein M1826_004933 [Phylliscum demangeonii]|nr:MAG: hypothetical protein M1826_004933 [Phylliscum demangeonii]
MAPPSSLPALPVALQLFVHHHVADNVLICITSGCKQAIVAKTMRQHLHRQHHVPSTLFPQLHTWITLLPPLADPETLPPRPPNTPQDPFLALNHVFQCAGCSLIQGTQKSIKQHARQAHVEPISPHFEMAILIVAQTWSVRKNMMYWSVSPIGDSVAPVVAPTPAPTLDLVSPMAKVTAAMTVQQEARDAQRAQLTAAPRADELTSWLRLTGWNIALTVTSLSLSELAAFAAMPWPGEQQLKMVCAVFNRIVARAIATLHATDPDLLMWLLSPKNKAPKQKPFALLQDKETLPRYVGT